MIVIRRSLAFEENKTKRIDAEYFNKQAVDAYMRLADGSRLGQFVKNGYRVVYENTKIVEREDGLELGLPFFLQAADICTPFINEERMNCVPESDWHRYHKGRVTRGELLIEVKGRAEKVAIVPDDFPQKTLVTGTCFKITTHSLQDRSFLMAYLTCRYGGALKDRLKTNLLVSYIAKDDLYRIPVPKVGDVLRNEIHSLVESSLAVRSEIKLKGSEVERTLLNAIGLADWTPPEPLTYSVSLSALKASRRWDSQFHRPAVDDLRLELERRHRLEDLSGRVLKGRSVAYEEDGEIPIIRSGDLTDIEDNDRFLRAPRSEPITYLHRGDVLVSSIGFGSIGKVQVFDKPGRYGAVSEVTIIRQNGFNPYYLSAFLRSQAGQYQIERFITGATGQLHLYPRDVENIFIPVIPVDKQYEFQELAAEIRQQRNRARELLDRARRAVEILIEDSEATAITYLGEQGGK